MRIDTDDKGNIILKEVHAGLTLKTVDGEVMGICMRDTGFEFYYQGEWYSAQKGEVKRIREETISIKNPRYRCPGAIHNSLMELLGECKCPKCGTILKPAAK